ncbi:MAG: undecaprenyl-diphosphate phosphatase [Burkholderiaceae bacterium]|nr:undecaprenyl-diphosphate phosphatase [Rhodoferax sp.]MCP5283668.1 undecaprenyl-diphosphate phosphatase [Burkholderiaceae bacterium]
MDPLLLLQAAVMGLVEGLTEFLPISSTGHLILTGALIGFGGPRAGVFEIAIQTGAMVAVLWEYRARLAWTLRGVRSDPLVQRFVRNVLIAFIPAVVFGLSFGSFIKRHLFSAVPVALALIVGGLLILWIEARHKRRYGGRDLAGERQARVESVDDMTAADALKVGLLQCLALIPGTSRSGATIMGGLLLGLSRKAAAEFSFYLAIPTLIGAGVYSVWKERALLSAQDLPIFTVGTVVAFFSALWCIRWLIRFISTHDFVPFAWYRIVFGSIVLATAWTGTVSWTP